MVSWCKSDDSGCPESGTSLLPDLRRFMGILAQERVQKRVQKRVQEQARKRNPGCGRRNPWCTLPAVPCLYTPALVHPAVHHPGYTLPYTTPAATVTSCPVASAVPDGDTLGSEALPSLGEGFPRVVLPRVVSLLRGSSSGVQGRGKSKNG